MIKKNIKKYALFCLTAVLACTMGVLINTPLNKVQGSTVSFTIENVEDINRVGTEIVLGDKITAEYNGNNVEFTKGAITFPDGKTYNVGTYKLTDVGRYTVRYYYMDNNVIVTAEKNFEVTDSYYALTSNSGSITTVTAESQKEAHEKEEVVAGNELALKNNEENLLLSGKDGLILRLKDGCKFIYNTPIDLSKAGEDGIAEILSVNYRLGNMIPNDDPQHWQDWMFRNGKVPSEEEFSFKLLKDTYLYRYVSDTASRCKIRLTDAYNPNIYVELDEQIARLSTDRNHPIFHQNYRLSYSAAANGQILFGCRKGSSKSQYNVIADINGEQYMAYENWNRAANTNGYLTSGIESQANGLRWGYDYKTNVVYAKDSGKWEVVNDLDNETIYPDNPFPGFTTGEVYLSLYFTDYNGAVDARTDILSINGVSGAELINQYNKSGRVDYVAPEIFIDYDETDPGVIYAPLNGEVELPSAFVKEVFSDGSYTVNVYTNYNTSYKKLVSTKNNKLKLTENTVYTVEYTAVDSSGQVGKATMNICPVNTEKAIWVETTKLESVCAGDLITLPNYKFKTINNENKVKYSIKVVGENETIVIDTDTNQFRPQYTGKYKIVYEFEDNAYSGVYEYEIDVTGDTHAKFLTKPLLPKYVIAGETYAFEMLKGYIFSATDVQEVETEGYISVDGGEFVKIDKINAYKITAKDKIQIKFKYGDVFSDYSEAKVISNVTEIELNGQKKEVFRLYKYFVGDYRVDDPFNVAGRPTNANIVYKMNNETGDQKLSFANIIDYDKFVFQFKPGLETNYQSLNIILTDVYDEDVKLVIKFYVKGSGHVISVNGVESFVNSPFASSDETYTIEYNKAKKQMIVNDLTFDFGFEKFNSNLCYFDVVMEKVNGPATIGVEKVGNHVFKGTKQKDDVVPQVNVVTSDGTYEIGSQIVLNVPSFTDIISQIDKTKNSMSIEHEDGTKIPVEDIYSPYVLTLDKLGVWSIIYNCEDTAGVKTLYRYAITVADRTAPEIVVPDYAEDTMILVKKGTIYKLNYTVTDNMTETENLFISVRMENMKTGEIINPSSTTDLKCTEEGDFKVYIVASDSYRNFSTKIVYLRVEGGNK